MFVGLNSLIKLIKLIELIGISAFDKTTISLCFEGAQPTSTILCNKLCRRGLIVDIIPTPQILCCHLF
jgi:hypothetical protein